MIKSFKDVSLNPVINVKSASWYQSNTTYVSGFIIDEIGIHTKESLCQKIKDYKDDFNHVISGEFAAILIEEDQIYLITDVIRSKPLFYKVEGENVYITDECYTFREGNPATLNLDSAKTFLHSGYTNSHFTLNQNVFQVEAGTIVQISKYSTNTIDYTNAGDTVLQSATPEDLYETLSEIFDDYIKVLNGRQVAISLSGGYDSRLILAMLHLKNYDNITCFSYGRPTLLELRNAEIITRTLNYSLKYINYDSIFDPNVLSNSSFEEYCRYASNDTSMFFLKQYFPASYLKENKLLKSDAVIIAGHTGDMISGSHLKPYMSSEKFSRKKFIDHLLRLHFDSFSYTPNCYKVISDSIHIPDTDVHWYKYESWERVNRQAKFIVNSNRAFNYFGYSTLVPLWDRRLLNFFRRLPFEQKLHCKLYRHTLKELIFKSLGINTETETHPSATQLTKQRIKDQVKKVIPKAITNQFINYDDPFYYKSSIDFMRSTGFDFVIPRQKNIWNAYLVQWYLHKEYNLSHSDIKQILASK